MYISILYSPYIFPIFSIYIYIYIPYVSLTPIALRGRLHIHRSEGFALTGYDIPGCVEDGAWMLWENSSVVIVVAVVVVAHPDLENGQFSSFVMESELLECADRSVSSSDCRRLYVRQKIR